MSLIHEALKKAEQQRRLGAAPTLDSPLFQRPRRRRWGAPLFALLCVAALAGAYAWFGRGITLSPAQAPAGAPVAVTQPAAPQAHPPETPAATKPVAQPAAKPPAPPRPAPTPRPVAAKTVPAALHPNQAKPVAAGVKPRPAGAAPPSATAITKDAWLPAPAAAERKQSAPPPPGKPEGNEPPRLPTKPPAQIAAVPPSPSPPAAVAPPHPPVAAAPSNGLPMYWELPYAQRKDLPAFKISMHVYAAKPAERFVILNGVRQVEGDDLPGGMKLVSIDPDGITVESNGKRFRVPRGGGY